MSEKMSIDFGMKLASFEKLNENFTRAKCYVLALGKNRNYSYLSKEAVDEAYDSLLFVPVVGHLMVDENGKHYLGGHDYKLNKDTLEFESLCVPFGVAIPTNSPVYESIVEDNGTTADYLVSDIVLWTGRYPELSDAIYSGDVMFGQSMEIFVDSCQKLEDDNRFTEITKFHFDALCMLNKSDDEFNVEPCFPSASIVQSDFATINAEFKEALNEMRNELQLYFNSMGGADLGANEENVVEETKANDVMEFSATYNKKRQSIQKVLDEMATRVVNDEGSVTAYSEYYLMDFDDKFAFVSKDAWEDGVGYSHSYAKIEYEFDEATFASKFVGEAIPVTQEWLTAEERAKLNQDTVVQFRETIEQMTSECNSTIEEMTSISEQYAQLTEEVEELRKYKSDAEKANRDKALALIYEKFDKRIGGIEDYINLKSSVDEYTVEEFEHECYAIKGKFDTEHPTTVAPETTNFATTLPVDETNPFDDVEGVANDMYGGLIEYYRTKE